MTSDMLISSSANLSVAWSEAFKRLMQRGVKEICPLIVKVSDLTNGVPRERLEIRRALDDLLVKSTLGTSHTVANTMFPDSLWNELSNDGADSLYRRFKSIWPKVKACPDNRRGTYFNRLVAYQPRGIDEPINQLDFIIKSYRSGNHRRSAMQASIFDPTRDHLNTRQLGFPCLQQVAFAPVGKAGLSVTGFYATQYVVDRAYGNYLGLCRLGRFVAKELGRELDSMTCIASIAQLGTPNKTQATPLLEHLLSLSSNIQKN
jgi:hypothetical protein